MNRIIVPVDFSDTSAAAVRFGTYLAETMNLDLTVLHVFDLMLSGSQTISARARDREQQRLEQQLREFAQRNVEPVLATFQGRLDLLPAITTSTLEGKVARTLLDLSSQADTELLIMGGVGAGAGYHPPGLFGSVARRLARNSLSPVILIPKDYGYLKVARLALAFDGTDAIRHMSAFTRRVITALRPEVHFVHVRDHDGAVEARIEEEFVELACGPGFPSYTYKFDALPAGKVTEALLHYAQAHVINLLVLGGQRRGFFERLFRPGHLRPLVNRCAVPLLVIPFLR